MPSTTPAPHLILRDFLAPDEHQALLAWALANEARFTIATLDGGIVNPARRRCQRLGDLGPSRAVLQHRLTAHYKDWLQQLRITAFELAELQLEIAAYSDGAHFTYHVDAARPTVNGHLANRRLTGVYYFFREPQQFKGGHIRLFPFGAGRQSEDFIAIPPQQNTLLVFPSWVGHEVTPIECPTQNFADCRFAVNCWLLQPPPPSSTHNELTESVPK